MNAIACWVSARFNDALASPFAFPLYVILRVIAARTLPPQIVTLYLSDFANVALILLAVEQARQAKKMEAQLDAMVEADPKIDEHALGVGSTG